MGGHGGRAAACRDRQGVGQSLRTRSRAESPNGEMAYGRAGLVAPGRSASWQAVVHGSTTARVLRVTD